MLLFNKHLGITSEDVAQCRDFHLLKKWLLRIEEEIVAMSLKISKAKTDAYLRGDYADPRWFHSIETARKLQIPLLALDLTAIQ